MNNSLCRLMVLLLALGAQPVWAIQSPLALVQETSDRVLAKVTDKKAELNETPSKIYALVEDIVLPHFDFVRMSRLVLGKYWRKATDTQRKAFTDQFRELLVRTYAVALLNYSGQTIKYLPMHEYEDAKAVTVNTEVREEGAPPIPINYRLYLNGEHWKVFDVIIDGISLVSNYRSSFSNQIRRKGLDSLIARLKKKNEQGAK
ncbi:MAG TPA: ABC transporter substrate-binding protein [Sedimenticola sp.]|nr:ABC transporter substrate-binding protein [Sedimenticola sp.]